MRQLLNSIGFATFSMIAVLFVTACTQADPSPQSETPTNAEKPVESAQVSDDMIPDITVTVLGSGTPIPAPDQYGASILVQAGDLDLIFDCGRGCTSRLVQVDRSLITSVENLFLTHLHSDHIVGIPDLWMNGWTQGRNNPLTVTGPPGTQQFFANLKAAFVEDINIRVLKGVPPTTDGISMAMTDIETDQVVFEKNGVTVTAFLVDHKPVDPAFGYRVDYAGRSVVISGDTTYSENLIRNSMDTDVILHEVLSPSMVGYLVNNFTDEQVQSVLAIHTTTEQAADIFSQTNPRLAVYYHTRNSPKDEAGLISVSAETYDGEVAVARDLFQIKIGDAIKTSVLE